MFNAIVPYDRRFVTREMAVGIGQAWGKRGLSVSIGGEMQSRLCIFDFWLLRTG